MSEKKDPYEVIDRYVVDGEMVEVRRNHGEPHTGPDWGMHFILYGWIVLGVGIGVIEQLMKWVGKL